MVIHGGAWRGGNKAQHRDLLDRFARRGYVAVSPQYRFCPKDLFPAQVLDVKAAVRWVKAHADEYHIDPTRIGAMGFSAGGHLALMLGLTDPDDGFDTDVPAGGPNTRVQAVVNYFGPTDLAADDIPDVSLPLVRDFLGGTAKEKPDLARQASPLTYVTSDDPPVLTFQGTRDPLVPYTQALKLADALTAAGDKGRVELILGGGHGNDWGAVELDRTFEQSAEFLDSILKRSK
jgi:acetyl esterase/lipase